MQTARAPGKPQASQSMFLLDWSIDNFIKFVDVANTQDPAQAPRWLRTLPPAMTYASFKNDIVYELDRRPERGFGGVVLTPVTVDELMVVAAKLMNIQNDDFMQAVAEQAFPSTASREEPLLAKTGHADCPVQMGVFNNLPAPERNGKPLRRLFS